eukprot:GHVS01045299.1.p1 GENE.GHVS01045299.1~~GHVS01045299.1.p1  ORF type:complete len:114 (+),score=13.37 GHVS01045299.1:3-344(+)
MTVPALVDCGAKMSTIGIEECKMLHPQCQIQGIEKTMDAQTTITGVGGEEPVHALLDLPTAVGGAMSTEVFYVINHPGVIIGMPWLQKAQAVLFMASGLLKFEDGTPSVQCPR